MSVLGFPFFLPSKPSPNTGICRKASAPKPLPSQDNYPSYNPVAAAMSLEDGYELFIDK